MPSPVEAFRRRAEARAAPRWREQPDTRTAEHLTSVVRGATARHAGRPLVSALPCRRRPGRQVCRGFIAVLRTEIPSSIEWRCVSCDDEGVISGWEQSPFDLSSINAEQGPGDTVRAVITPEVAATLRSLT